MRRAGRRDATHAEVRDALREQGWTVEDMGHVGGDFPDLVAFHPKMRILGVQLVEVKGVKPTIQPGQAAFADRFPVAVLRTRAQALEFHAEAFARWCAILR